MTPFYDMDNIYITYQQKKKKKVLLMFANVRLMFVVFHFFRHVTQSLVQRKLYLVVIFN